MPERKTVLIALAANAAITVVKLVAGIVSGSAAMLAEGAHSVADTANQAFLLLSIQRGERAPDEEHPFGHGKERFFWSFLAAVMIFLAGGEDGRRRGHGGGDRRADRGRRRGPAPGHRQRRLGRGRRHRGRRDPRLRGVPARAQ